MRCERASSYLRSKGIDDVSQLSGGIHAYQETFPEGGYFRGKNFVFDPRIVVPSAANTDDVIGTCCVCSRLYDDYSRQCRCSKCRVLVLVCDDCVAPQQAESEIIVKPLLCEQCLSEVSHHTS